MKKLILMTIMLGFIAAPALANPTFGDGGAALQGVFDGIADSGTSIVKAATDALSDTSDSIWSTTATGQTASTLIVEMAGFAGSSTFGIYDAVDKTNFVQIFTGPATDGAIASISIFADGSIYLNALDTGIDFAGDAFGYYLDATVGNNRADAIFYSDTNLNADSFDHMGAYQGVGQAVTLPLHFSGPWTANDYILAFEDLYGGGDRDFTDFVVMVESVHPIPAPGAILLGSIGVGFVGWLRRRRTL